MKTKFFKKLSFVLAVAMVLSVLYPAAGVFAAKKPKLNATSKYLHLDVEGKNEYDFNISNKQKGWKYDWESANEDVVVVDNKGVVTATGVGKTKVTVYITDKDGEEVAKLSAKVTVRDNIKEVKITNIPEGNKLAVGQENDFNRSFVTVSGSTKKTSAITRWTVEPSDTATIDDKGVFKATKAGKYTITARSFQSKEKYEYWLSDNEAYKDYVLATDSVEITVEPSIVDIKQVNKNTFTVEFDSSMKDTDLSEKTATVYQVIGGKLYNTGTEKIKSLALDEAGKVATVELYGNLVSKGEYQFTYGELKGLFKAANTDMSEVAGIVFDDFQVKVDDNNGVDMLEYVKGVNKDGVVIKDGSELRTNATLTFEYKGELANGWVDGTKAYIKKEGYSAKILAKFLYYAYNENTKTYDKVEFEDEAYAIGVKTIVANTTLQFAVAESQPSVRDDSKWSTSGFVVAAGDENYKIFTRYKKNTDPAGAGYTLATTEFRYDTTSSDKLVISGNSLFPIKEGVVTVLVKDANSGDVIGAFDLTIAASRGYASAEVAENVKQLGNHDFGSNSPHNESVRFTITNKDTLGANLIVDSVTWEYVNKPTKTSSDPAAAVDIIQVTPSIGTGDDAGKVFLDVKATNSLKGTYQLKVSLRKYNDTKVVYLYVTVLEGQFEKSNRSDVVRWALELSKNEVDLKKVDDNTNVSVNVYGYNTNGARVAYLNADTEYEIEVKKANTGEAINSNYTNTSIPVAYVSGTALTTTGNSLKLVDRTTYVVYAKAKGNNNPTGRGDGVVFYTETLTVKDSTELKPEREKTTVSKNVGTVAGAVFDAYNFYINGIKLNEVASRFRIKYSNGGALETTDGNEPVNAGDHIYIDEITYEYSWGNNNYVAYTFTIHQTITVH